MRGIACSSVDADGGKTELSAMVVIRRLLMDADAEIWIVAPTYDQADRSYETFTDPLPAALIENRKETKPREVTLITGARVSWRSADRPSSLRGAGLDFVVVDEAAYITDDTVWSDAIRPTLSDQEGESLIVSTPTGRRSWFYDAFLKGESTEYPEWASFQFPTSTNPYITDKEIAEFKAENSERSFREEYLAEFVDEDAAAVFSTAALDAVFQQYDYEAAAQEATPPVSIGLDLGRANDYTVITALDATGRLVGFKRMRRTSWSAVEEAAYAMYAQFCGWYAEKREKPTLHYGHARSSDDPTIYADGTRDSPLIETLRDEIGEHAIESVRFTSKSKKTLMERLASKIDHSELTLPTSLDVLRSEMEAFETQINSSTGHVSYDVRTGHDDTVDSLALAASGATVSEKSSTKVSRFIFVDEPARRGRRSVSRTRSSSFGDWRP